MKIPAFIGGTDEQRSNNLSDNKLINLYPTTNNDGSISAFYKVDGLKSEGTLSGVPTGAYKASNGRAFYTSGTVLYELTVPAGVYTSTSRGDVTGDAYDLNAMSWTPQTSGITGFSTSDIAWNGIVYCAIGSASGTSTTACYTSPDGVTWTARTMSSNATWSSIVWNGTVFCAVASSVNGSNTTIAATSSDGITWTTRVLSASSHWYAIAWNGTVFCAVSGDSGTVASTSPDGVTWTARTLPSAQGWQAIAWNGTVFCAVASTGTAAATSIDGITWTARTLPSSSVTYRAIAWNGTVFCIIENASTIAATSTDGITWTARTVPENASWRDIKVIANVFCIVSTTNNNTYFSIDGITWTLSIVSGIAGLFCAIGTNGNNFVIAGQASPATTAISTALQFVGGVQTTNYEFSDNGLEMIMVNGTDGWIFTFSTNALLKLTVLTGNFTVQAATAVDVDATLTKTAHGLIVGDRVILTTTGSLPTYLLPNTAYYVLADGFTVDAFKVGLTLTGATCTISNGTPCTITSASHNYIAGDKIRFLTTGALPASLAVGTIYYVISAGITQDTFRISLTLGGAAINTTTAGSGVHSFNPAITIIQSGQNTCTLSTKKITNGTCTISVANPAICTKVTHGLVADDQIRFITTGTLPSGISTNITFFVLSAGLTADVFQISLVSGGTPVETTTSGSGTHTFTYVTISTISTISSHNLSIGDVVQFTTTGSLPTGVSALTDYYVTGNALYIPFGSSGNLYFSCFGDPTIVDGMAIRFFTNGSLPEGIIQGTTYYIIGTITLTYFQVSEFVGGSAIPLGAIGTGGTVLGSVQALTDNRFGITSTFGGIGYGIAISFGGSQSGIHSFLNSAVQPYGIHTYTTGGSGFPNGAKTVSYMNGRFICCDPNTQDFYVSEVLNGKTWDAINVQTVDSNPDYVTGQIVAHNELFVFCENSGETYYDSGTTPTPFVRNLTGIFEVGCKAPYTIKEIGGAVIFLGNTNSGNGIVYRMAGLTPVRISTYSIEYQIQQMTDISDARAFTYQKDGHHFYVLTFPTGDKTFVFDASTSLWHEREKTIPITTVPSTTWAPQSSGIINQSTNDAAWNGTVFCAIGRTTAGGATDQCYTSPDGITWAARTMPSSQTWWAIAWNGTVFCAIAGGQLASDVAATSPDGITWTARTLSASKNWYDIAWNGAVFCAVESVGSTAATSPDGITWTGRALNPPQGYFRITSDGSSFVATGLNTNKLSKSADGITWSSVTLPTSGLWSAMGWNGINYLIIEGSTIVSISASSVALTSPDGATWTQRALPETAKWSDIDVINGVFTIINVTNNNTYSSLDGITWTLSAISGSVADFYNIVNNLTNFVTIGNGNPAITAISNAIVLNDPTYAEWPVNKYLYFNNQHLTTDDTASLFSIDSSTYRNGTNPIRIIRSFRAPPSDMKRVAHHTIQVDCEVGIGTGTEPVIALRWSDDAGNTWSTPIERGLGLVGDHAKSVTFRRLGATKGLPRIYELSCDENVKITLLDCYLE